MTNRDKLAGIAEEIIKECKEYYPNCEDQHLGFHLGNAVKYISRAGRKDPARTVEDLRKAAWYLNRQIERLERGGNE